MKSYIMEDKNVNFGFKWNIMFDVWFIELFWFNLYCL